MSAKMDFIKEAKMIKRNGVSSLLQYLEEGTDFFTAPASTKFHGAHEVGLLLHSLTVLDIMVVLDDSLDLNLSKESLAICGLLHDVCKANFYQLDEEEPSQAQLKYAQDLCEQVGIKMPAKTLRSSSIRWT